MSGKLFIKTFGCQMNEYDSGRMADALRDAHGLELVGTPEEADVLLLNTCSVREKAQEKVFSQLGRWRHLKRKRPGLIIGVGGCVASQEGAAIQTRAPYVDLVFGPQTLHRLPEMLSSARRQQPVVDITFPEIEKFDALPPPRVDGASASVSIIEGCSKYCTFCVVPYTRGEEVSRPFDDVIAEVMHLARQGVRELTLLGQNVNAYRGIMDDGGEADLALLLRWIAEVEGIERIRYSTSHPVEFSDNLIRAHQEVRKLADHVHLPVQSGSDRILALMKRGHTTLEYKSRIRKLREANPRICISSDFIVGFPGETAADFEATMSLIDAVRFDHSYSFIYSPRPGTPAESLPDDVPMEEKQRRLARLQHRINELSMEISSSMVGSEQVVLVSGQAKKGGVQLAGRTSNNRIVNFSGDAGLIGRFVSLVITEALPNSLRGELVSSLVDVCIE
ncbi:MAG: tRNA (N6-isopentenyl adenosine(37)-C2)-methylthiotransferase MiaB [Gammaproteobacteria bacterium]|nr:tRNA (N6-isopentenyl adenosine(37)-C2)-methylthiotransferase MiaB [Gammaproteobacteria bacterium]